MHGRCSACRRRAQRRNDMHTWLAAWRRLSSVARKNPSKLLLSAFTLFMLQASTAFAQPSEAGGEATLQVPDLSTVSFLGMNGHSILLIGLIFCAFGLLFGLMIYMQLKKLAGSPRHARNLRADLRDLQDVRRHPGQVPDDPVGLHRCRHPGLLRMAGAGAGQSGRGDPADHSAV